MKRPVSKARKLYVQIVVIFVLFIIIPCIILSYFAITTIQTEADAIESRETLAARDKAVLLVSQVTGEIDTAADTLARKAADFFSDENAKSADEFFTPLENSMQIAKRIFAAGSGGVIYPPGKLPYVLSVESSPDFVDLLSPSSFDCSSLEQTNRMIELRRDLEDRMLKAGALEQRDKDYKGALEIYAGIALETAAPDYAATGKIGMARCLHDLGDHENSVRIWLEIMDESPTLRFSNDVPVVQIAVEEAVACLKAMEKYPEAADVCLRFYQRLLDGSYSLVKREYRRYVAEVREKYETIEDTGKLPPECRLRYDALKTREAEANESAAFFEFIADTLPEHLTYSMENGTAGASEYFRRQTGDEFWTLCYRRVAGRAGLPVAVGFMLDSRYFLGSVVPRHMEQLGLTGRAEVVPPGAPASPTAAFETPFTESLAGYAVRGFKSAGASAADTTGFLYGYLALIIALILVIFAGVLISLRNIGREIELAKLKNDFVANVTHELKTPLTSIRMFSEMLKLGRVPSDVKRQEYYNLIAAESERLTRLINNILDFARIEEGRKEYKMEAMDAASVVSKAVESFRPFAEGKGFEIRFDAAKDLPPVRADADAVAQAVINLLSNAQKYSGDSRIIEVNVFSYEDGVAVRVTDHGIGISREEQAKLFEKFYRVGDHLSSEVAGTGLGLTLVDRIVKAHGGDVGVQSAPGEGSAFTIYLPAYKEPDEPAEAAGARSGGNGKDTGC
jgi:signal transduction histidine kinase